MAQQWRTIQFSALTACHHLFAFPALCSQALINTAAPVSHTSATIELTPPATSVAVQKYICVVCLLRKNVTTAAAPSAVVTPASGFTCPYGRQPIVKECATTSCTVTGLGAGKLRLHAYCSWTGACAQPVLHWCCTVLVVLAGCTGRCLCNVPGPHTFGH